MRHILLISMIVSIAILTMNCSKDSFTTVGSGAQQFEGWAGPPENPDKGVQEYFYMKYTGRASQNALDKRSGTMMQTTCRDAAEMNAKGDIIQKLAEETVKGASGVSDGESTGKVVVREFNSVSSGMNTKECKALSVADPNIPFSEWKECQCVMFVRIPGGRDAVLAKAKAKMAEEGY